MTLNSGIGYCYTKGDVAEMREKIWDTYDKDEKHWYSNVLPFLMLGTGINAITKETIPEIIWRDRRFPMLSWEKWDNEKHETADRTKSRDEVNAEVTEWLEKFIGFQANVGFETTKEWFDRHAKRDSKFLKKKQIETLMNHVQDMSDKGFFAEMLKEHQAKSFPVSCIPEGAIPFEHNEIVPPVPVKKIGRVSVNREHYKYEHDHYPYGRGYWAFEIGKKDYWFPKHDSGDFGILYGKAKALAIEKAKELGISHIKVLS